MFKKSSIFLVNTFVMLAGLLLVLLYDEARLMEGIVIVLGIMFLVPSVISLVLMLSQMSRAMSMPDDETDAVGYSNGGLLPSIGGICFGLSLILRPLLFVEILAYLFAIILIIGGLYHIVMLLITSRRISVSLWLYALPVLVAVAGFVLIMTDVRTVEKWVNLITGIALMCFSVASLTEYIAERRALKKKQPAEAEAVDGVEK